MLKRNSAAFLLASLLLATMLSAAGTKANEPNAPASQAAAVNWLSWNFRGMSAQGHTGKTLILAKDQVHEGPGKTGAKEAAAHWHWRDPQTGALSPTGVPFNEKWETLPNQQAPKNDPNAVFPAQATPELLQQWEAPLKAEVTQAALAGQWRQVQRRLLQADEALLSPLARALLGQAFLATNDSNRALALLSSISLPLEVNAYKQWAGKFAGQNEANGFAAYLYGDALARSGDKKVARAQLDRALAKNPQFALALNARGLVRLAEGDMSGAEQDFAAALKHDPKFLDGYINLGNYHIIKNEPDGALASFAQAVKMDPVSALALNGRGCAYDRKGERGPAVADFQAVLKIYPHQMALMNLALLEGKVNLQNKLTPGEGAGTAVGAARLVGDAVQEGVQRGTDAVIKSYDFLAGRDTSFTHDLSDTSTMAVNMRADARISSFNSMRDAWRQGNLPGGAVIISPQLSSQLQTSNSFTLNYTIEWSNQAKENSKPGENRQAKPQP